MRKSEVLFGGKYLTRVGRDLVLVEVTGTDGARYLIRNAKNYKPLSKARTASALRHTKGSHRASYQIPSFCFALRWASNITPPKSPEREPKPAPKRKPRVPSEPRNYHVSVSCRSIVAEFRAWLAKRTELRPDLPKPEKSAVATYLRSKLRAHLQSRATYIAIAEGRLHESERALWLRACYRERNAVPADSARVACMMGADPEIVHAIMGAR